MVADADWVQCHTAAGRTCRPSSLGTYVYRIFQRDWLSNGNTALFHPGLDNSQQTIDELALTILQVPKAHKLSVAEHGSTPSTGVSRHPGIPAAQYSTIRRGTPQHTLAVLTA
jgi:hypothetical protein